MIKILQGIFSFLQRSFSGYFIAFGALLSGLIQKVVDALYAVFGKVGVAKLAYLPMLALLVYPLTDFLVFVLNTMSYHGTTLHQLIFNNLTDPQIINVLKFAADFGILHVFAVVLDFYMFYIYITFSYAILMRLLNR